MAEPTFNLTLARQLNTIVNVLVTPLWMLLGWLSLDAPVHLINQIINQSTDLRRSRRSERSLSIFNSISLSWQLSLGLGAAALFVIIAAWAGAGAGAENSWKVDNDSWLAAASFRSDCWRMQDTGNSSGSQCAHALNGTLGEPPCYYSYFDSAVPGLTAMNVLLAGIAAGVLLRAVVIGRLWYTDSLRTSRIAMTGARRVEIESIELLARRDSSATTLV